jgi:hypothetical protein
LFHSHECRHKAEEADELAQKATDYAVRTAYEEIARLWREVAERPNGTSGRPLGWRPVSFYNALRMSAYGPKHFFKGLIEKSNSIVQSELLGPALEGAVARDFVVLGCN